MPGPHADERWFNASWRPEDPLVPAADLHPLARSLMEPSETLLWTGGPGRIRCLLEQRLGSERRQRAAMVASGVCVMALSCALLWFGRGPITWMLLGGIIWAGLLACGALGVCFLTGLAYLGAFAERADVYAISDRRLLRIQQCPRRAVRSYRAVDPLSVAATGVIYDRGDLTFAEVSDGARGAFLDIPQVRQVEKLLLATLLRGHGGGAPACEPAELPAGATAEQGGHAAGAGRSASPLVRLLRASDEEMDGGLVALDPSIRPVEALGVLGMWRPLSSTSAKVLLGSVDGHPNERACARAAVKRLGKGAVLSLIRAAADASIRDRAQTALGWVDTDILTAGLGEGLLENDRDGAIALADRWRYLRGAVVDDWVRMGHHAAGPLASLLRCDAGRARYWAAEALGRLAAEKGASAGPRLFLGPDADPGDPPVAVALAYLGDASGLAALTQASVGDDWEACCMASEALGHLGAPAAPALGALRQARDAAKHPGERAVYRRAIRRIQAALGEATAELESAAAPAGLGTEMEAASAPEGKGAEPLSTPAPIRPREEPRAR